MVAMTIRTSTLFSILFVGLVHAAIVADVGGGYVPASGPAKGRAATPPVIAQLADRPGHPNAPHVHTNDVWIGHGGGPADPRYHLDQPWRKGRFTGGFGRGHLFPLDGMDADRFWFKGLHFTVLASDRNYGNDWFWDSDQVAVFEDPDHVGWYLVYNVRLGTYLHAMYQGAGSQEVVLPDAPAKGTLESVCSTCHEVRTSPPRTKTAWTAVVNAMAARGATATEQQFKDITDYLSKYFGVVNINQAPANEIADTVGIPVQSAGAIVQYRTEHGPLSDLDAVKRVPGLDLRIIEEHKANITFK
jgi:competence ComEA-like helix-hairpin-helix protein